jgi:hypothetical protein
VGEGGDGIFIADDSVAKMYLGNWSDYETMMREKFGKNLEAINFCRDTTVLCPYA